MGWDEGKDEGWGYGLWVMGYGLWVRVRVRVRSGVRVSSPPDLASSFFALTTWLGLG